MHESKQTVRKQGVAGRAWLVWLGIIWGCSGNTGSGADMSDSATDLVSPEVDAATDLAQPDASFDLVPDLSARDVSDAVSDDLETGSRDATADLDMPVDLWLDPCAGVDCDEHGACLTDSATGQAYCQCVPGWSSGGLHCVADVPALTVHVRYEGALPLQSVRLLLFASADAPQTCNGPFYDLPAADLASEPGVLTDAVVFPVGAFVDLQPGGSLDFLAVALATVGSEVRAAGCLPLVTVQDEQPTEIEITLTDLPPRLGPTLQLRLTFDFAADAPIDAQGGLFLPDLLENLTTIDQSPGALTVAFCRLPQPEAQQVCAASFADPMLPDPANLTLAGTAILQTLDNHGTQLHAAACTAGVCGSLEDLLAQLAVRSELTLLREPDIAGVVAGPDFLWHFTMMWPQPEAGALGCAAPADADCPAAPLAWFSSDIQSPSGGQGTATVTFDPVSGTGTFALQQASVGTGLGTLLRAAVEDLILAAWQQAAGAPLSDLSGIDAWLARLLGGLDCTDRMACCEAFANAVTAQTSDVDAAILQLACAQVVDAFGPQLRDGLVGIDGSAGFLVLDTAAAAPCTLSAPAGAWSYPRLADADQPCHVTVRAPTVLYDVFFGATLFGVR